MPENPTSIVLSLRRATVRRAGRKVFAGTDWTIRAGEHWAVVGPNGAGKSTLLRALWGGWPLCAGELDFAFERTSAFQKHFYFSVPEEAVTHAGFADQRACIRRHLEFFQERWYSGGEHEAPTVDEFLSWEAIRGITPFQVDAAPPDPARYRRWRARAIRLLGLKRLLPQRIHLLSNGEWRRMLIARALMQNPALLVLDDPWAGLDAAARARLERHLLHLFRGAMPLVLAVPHPEHIPAGITHALLVDRDRVLFAGSLAQARRAPAWRRLFPAERHHAATKPRAPKKAAAPVILQCHRVTIRLGGRRIIDRLDWTVRAGEHWALVGPNGAGKSTLAGLISGDIPQAYSQDITLFGHRRDEGQPVSEIKRRIGFFAPELLAQFPEQLTVRAVVASGLYDTLGLFRTCSGVAAARVRRWLGRFGLTGLARRRFGDLSEGGQRMVLLARALVKQPELLILDEPFQNLDAARRARLRRVLEGLAGGRTALVLITHNPADLPRTIAHTLRLERGRAV